MIGKALSHFQITAKLGEGGMGEVYRATDTKLGREVAIKVLPEEVAGDAERLARFEREAKVLAALDHPNIAAIYGLEEADGRQLLVMQLAEGETLHERIARGVVPPEEAIPITIQIAQAIEAAHEKGIIHRDLKPANIKLTLENQVKVLDFGLAKALDLEAKSGEESGSQSMSPTLTAQMTGAGVILGTAAYMSPEQARGQVADLRADIWAVGVVLWEMLAGQRLFAEPTVSDTLAAVLRAEIDYDVLPRDTSHRLQRTLKRCLERDRGQRYHAAADLRLDLEESLEDEPGVQPLERTAEPPSRLPWVAAAVASVLALLFALLAFWPSDEGTDSTSRARIVTSMMPTQGVDFAGDVDALALSPDGTLLAFVGVDADGQEGIWIRPLARDEVRLMPKTDGAYSPFWSPDGRWLGFGQDQELKIVEIESGLIEVVARQPFSEGASWNLDGDIIFAEIGRGIMTVKQTGGVARSVTQPSAGGNEHLRPSFLPDGQHFLFHERRYSSDEQIGEIRVGSLDGQPSRLLFEAYSMAEYVEPGYVLWWNEGNLRAQRFDADSLELSGEPFSVVSDILWDPRNAIAGYTASDTGLLIYRSGGRIAGNQLTWIARNGDLLGTAGPTGSIYSQSLSPDGLQIAVDISGDSNQGDIWVIDSESDTSTPVVVWPEDDSYPVWSPDGRELAFYSTHGGDRSRIFRVDFSGGGDPELMLADDKYNPLPRHWTRDGGTLIFLTGERQDRDIAALDLESGTVQPIIQDEFDTQNPSLSPDGHWIVFDSNMTGRKEVYLAPYPDANRKVRISTEGGFAPLWARDGSEIFFASLGSDAIFAVGVTFESGEPDFGRPTKLFSTDLKLHSNRQYDTADGQRFLVIVNLGGVDRRPPTVLQNWADGS